MNRDEAAKVVRAHEAELRARGVTRLAIFGSTARGQARPDSDVDVLVDIDDKRKISLFDLAGLRLYLCDILGQEVEVARRKALKPFLRDNILAEAIEIFPCLDGQSPQPKGVPMPKRDPRQRLHDMMDAITALERSVTEKTLDDTLGDDILRAATERRIEIVSEASRHLPEALKERHPEIPWRQVANIGNILRHGYEIVDHEILWNAATRELAPLKNAVEAMLTESGKSAKA